MRRALPLLLALLALLAASLSSPLTASAQDTVVDKPRRGADAVRALGDRISTVARTHDTTAAVLRERFQTDSALWVHPSGRLFYVDPPAPDQTDSTTTTSTTTATTSAGAVPQLQSRPGASRTVLLDFDGVGPAYGGTIGAGWNSGTYTGGDGNAEPYSEDTSLTFSAAEVTSMHSIWERVAEDFAPFDVNVTTVDLGSAAIERSSSSDTVYGTRVAMTSSSTTCGCGGVAYIGTFDHYGVTYPHSYYQPAFVYNKGTKAAAEAATHEAGHNLGLSHDGTKSDGYYKGHGDWAPIMGVGYYEPISQWSRGEYSGANNPEDDFALAVANGAPIRGDDHGTGANATAVAPGRHAGVIETRTDVDGFAFSVEARTLVTIDVTPAPVSPNLDLSAVLRNASGTVVAEHDPPSAAMSADVASGLGAALSLEVEPGSYVLSVDGVGRLDPLTTGYSDYGSVGAYAVSLTGSTVSTPVSDGGGGSTDTSGDTGTTGGDSGTPPPVTDEPTAAPTAPVLTGAKAVGSTATVTWTHDGAGKVTSFEVRREKQQRNGTWVLSGVATLAASATSHSESPGTGTFRYAVRALNKVGPSGLSAWGIVTTGKTSGSKTTRS